MKTLWLWIVLTAVVAHGAEPTRPNIVVMLPDQWRAQAFGFAGDPNVKTPNLDRLAKESCRFINAVAGLPVCCPTRASLLTGQRPLTTGVFMNDVALDPEAVSIAKVLGAAGYATGYIGKWHLNGDGRSRFIPPERRQGFEFWRAQECTHDYNHSTYYGETGEMRQWEGYDAVAQTAEAVGYVREEARKGKPFLLFVAWGPPHDPYGTAPAEERAKYDAKKIKVAGNVPEGMREWAGRALAGYYAHCTALDECVGKLWSALRETEVEENTILVFTSDHGGLLGAHGGRNKQQPYDESIRVPLLVHWPTGLGRRERKLKAVINSEDIMPTLLGLAGVRVSESVEGLDYSGYMRGGANPEDGAALISCVAPFGQWTRMMGGREYRGIRTERYTYVRDLRGPWLLFDNERDPGQMRNLVAEASAAKILAKLDALLRMKLARANDQFLPADSYIGMWNYTVDENGTVPYEP